MCNNMMYENNQYENLINTHSKKMELVIILIAGRGLGLHGSLLWGQEGNLGSSGASVTDVARVRLLHMIWR